MSGATRDDDYACPQCGPDPRGAIVHGEAHHTWPPGKGDGVYYERLGEGAVARTVTASDAARVDVDKGGLVVGVEVLDGGDWREALAQLARAGRLAVPRKDA